MGSGTRATRRDVEPDLQYLASADLAVMSDTAILRRSLTLKSVICTPSSFASLETAGHPEMVQIGAGLQGAVFEQV